MVAVSISGAVHLNACVGHVLAMAARVCSVASRVIIGVCVTPVRALRWSFEQGKFKLWRVGNCLSQPFLRKRSEERQIGFMTSGSGILGFPAER